MVPTSALDELLKRLPCEDRHVMENMDKTARPGWTVFLTALCAIATGALAGLIVGATIGYSSGFALWIAALGAGVGALAGAMAFFAGLAALPLACRHALTDPVRQTIVVAVSALVATLTVLGICLTTRAIDFAGILVNTFVLSAVLALIRYRLLKNRLTVDQLNTGLDPGEWTGVKASFVSVLLGCCTHHLNSPVLYL